LNVSECGFNGPFIGYKNLIQETVAVNLVCGYFTHMAISGNQLKAARALAGLDQKALADGAKVSINTIRSMESAGVENVRGRTDTLNAVVAALKSAGVIFVEENGEGAGVRLKKAK
jgi:hypothetical protein